MGVRGVGVAKNKVTIYENIDRKFEMTIDGVEIHGVRYVEYESGVEQLPTITLEFIPREVDITIEGEEG